LLAAGVHVLLLFYKSQVIAMDDLAVALRSGRGPAIKIVATSLWMSGKTICGWAGGLWLSRTLGVALPKLAPSERRGATEGLRQ
jgi:hypothetical protein